MAAALGSSCNLESVLQAVNKLYHEPNTNDKEKASRWLQDFQRSIFAWETADQLLQMKHDVESTYFAAQTIRSKILYSFRELPENTHESLKDSLLRHIESLYSMSPAILTQLCLAVCDLALQMPGWHTPAITFMQQYGNNKESHSFLLELLTLLPEEVKNRTLRLGANRRSDIMEEMENCAPMVIDLIKACLTHESLKNERMMMKLMKCLASWFQLGVLPGNHVARIKLLEAPYDILRDIEAGAMVHEAACECVCAALYACEDVSRHRDLIMVLFKGCHQLKDTFHVAVAHEDTDKCINLCRVFSDLSEALLEPIVQHPNDGLGDLKTLDLLLICNGHFQYEVAEITFNVWYRLSDMLHESSDALKRKFAPYIQRLIHSLVTHCQIEPDNDVALDESNDFYDFRMRVSDLVKDVVGLIGDTECFVHLFAMLTSANSGASWDLTEATLFIMSAIANNIDLSENEATVQVLHAILSLPPTSHVMLKQTSVVLVGQLSKWISAHPQLIDAILQFLTVALQERDLSSAAATSLQHLCTACTKEMTPHYSSLVQLITVCDELNISAAATLGLLKGVICVLSQLEADECKECVKRLCISQMQQLEQLMQTPGSDVTIPLDRVATIFRGFHGDDTRSSNASQQQQVTAVICQQVFKEIWGGLEVVLSTFSHENRVVERWCRCVRFAVRSAGSSDDVILNMIAQAITTSYHRHQHSCFLYLGSVLVDVYDSHPSLLQMLNTFLQPLFRLLNKDQGLDDNPDTVDDLFRLCTRFVDKSPLQFLQHEACSPLLKCAITCLKHQHRDANMSVTKFLRSLITSPLQQQNGGKVIVDKVVKSFGYEVTSQSLQACLFHIPSFLYPDIAELWWALMQHDRAVFSEWLKETLGNLPVEQTLATATYEQTLTFHAQVTACDQYKNVSYYLRDFCRLYR